VDFLITLHSGYGAPEGAIERLAEALGPRRGGARFGKVGREIRASWSEEMPISMERDEREELGRLAMLEILRDLCDGSSGELDLRWFAVSVKG
jgi:hypothetical protein